MVRGRFSKSQPIPVVPYLECLAKTYRHENGQVLAGRTVLNHCQIVGNVAQELIARYPQNIARHLFPSGSPLVAASHDIGKVSPTFFEKIRRNLTTEADLYPVLPVNPEQEKQWGGHAGVSLVAAKKIQAPKWIPEILGQHHGFSPSVDAYSATSEVFGGADWQAQRELLVKALKAYFNTDWPEQVTEPQARVLAGLTSVADWIGSGEYFEDPKSPWEFCAAAALDKAGFISPCYNLHLTFEDVFGFSPREEQRQLMAVVNKPGVYVLEAPMGIGKTEAALYAAYQLLQKQEATGVYFALPTQLTSNKIYERFRTFLTTILHSDCQHRPLLLHANAWLMDLDMGEEGRPGGAWFNHSKRGLLAPFAVGTVDQALMAAMNVKHGFVRAFGLAGKVVILDEVHTYDAYTSTLLEALVQLLRELHCTVIILSATLSQQRRSQLMKQPAVSSAYPLISACDIDHHYREHEIPAPNQSHCAINLVHQERSAIEEALTRAAQGQYVLWIENTVKEAQNRYLDLAAQAAAVGVSCGLLHSRYTMADRQKNEEEWVNRFGKAGWAQRSHKGSILIGTQVLEQSLDIDADFLVTRFAPTDMLLQRLGRLWRHANTPRSPDARPEAWIMAPTLEDALEAPQSAFGGTASVYNPYVLCRSLDVWQTKTGITLPQDIRHFIESTYAEREEQGNWQRWLYELDHGTTGHRARKGRIALGNLARRGLATDGKTLPESHAQTRYSESESIEVLVVRSIDIIDQGQACRLKLLTGETCVIPKQKHKRTLQQWKQLTVELMQHLVKVPLSEAPKPCDRPVLEKYFLHHCFYLGDPVWSDDQCTLRVVCVDELDQLHGLDEGSAHEQHRLEYRQDLGFRMIKQNAND